LTTIIPARAPVEKLRSVDGLVDSAARSKKRRPTTWASSLLVTSRLSADDTTVRHTGDSRGPLIYLRGEADRTAQPRPNHFGLSTRRLL